VHHCKFGFTTAYIAAYMIMHTTLQIVYTLYITILCITCVHNVLETVHLSLLYFIQTLAYKDIFFQSTMWTCTTKTLLRRLVLKIVFVRCVLKSAIASVQFYCHSVYTPNVPVQITTLRKRQSTYDTSKRLLPSMRTHMNPYLTGFPEQLPACATFMGFFSIVTQASVEF
jgi:hypothetical protein